LSGVGAAKYPGRWNRVGQEAIYTSVEMGVPVLERLVHTSKELIPSNLSMMTVYVREDWIKIGNALVDRASGGWMAFYRTLGEAKASFQDPAGDFGGLLRGTSGAEKPFAIAVPSVVVPRWNVVLYPAGLGFWRHVSLESIDTYEFDPRLFPEDTPLEV